MTMEDTQWETPVEVFQMHLCIWALKLDFLDPFNKWTYIRSYIEQPFSESYHLFHILPTLLLAC